MTDHELTRLRKFRDAVVRGTCGGSLSPEETKSVVMKAIHDFEELTKKETGSYGACTDGRVEQ